jgi:LmbE family N-acetylglucosaminyl deacetylase
VNGGTRKQKKFAVIAALCAAAIGSTASRLTSQSLPETAEAIGKARISTRVLFITAHPDDEWSGVLAYLSHGLKAEVGLLTLTRGQGGQNAIGPEQDGPLGVIRTEELLAAGKHYGVQQFFTRAMDFGFSKSPEQTIKIWDGVVLEDMVRTIRTFRPEVVINGWGGYHSGHGHHQASGILTPQAVLAAADPKLYPDQIAEGLAAWKTTLVLRLARNESKDGIELPENQISPLWGESYSQMGADGHALHRSQGTPAYQGRSFYRDATFLVAETGGNDGGQFDPKLLAEPITALAARYPQLRRTLAPGLAAADEQLARAEKDVLDLDRAAAAKSLARAGETIRLLQSEISKSNQASAGSVSWELAEIRQRIDFALEQDVALAVQTNAERHELVAGDSVVVEARIAGDSAVPVTWTLHESSLVVPPGWNVATEKSTEPASGTRFRVHIPARAKPSPQPADVIQPFPPPLISLALPVRISGYDFTIRQAVQSVEAKTIGVFTYPLELVPAVTLTVEPPQAMLPVQRSSGAVTLLARVRYHGTEPAKVTAGLDAPQGWSSEPVTPLDFSAAGDRLIRFVVTPPSQPAIGSYKLNPFAKLGDETFRLSLEPIPTLPTRDWFKPDDATVHVLDLNIPAGLHIGYIATESDPLPDILRQLGIKVDLLDEVDLAFGDLSKFDAITVGFRAYELRPDVMRSNPRLLDYARNGGTLLVQYQRNFAGGPMSAAPFPAEMPEATSRVTDAKSPVRFLAPDHPVLNFPNKITVADFDGWIQERGIYFWGAFDPKYTPLLGLTDPGEPETKGSLVYAKDGSGVYIYTGLSFFRELPAGIPGAYRLFVNLLSQSKVPVAEN